MRAGRQSVKRCQALETQWRDSNRSFGEVLRVIYELYSAPFRAVNWIRILRWNAWGPARRQRECSAERLSTAVRETYFGWGYFGRDFRNFPGAV